MSHTSLGKSLSPPLSVAILAKNKTSALEKVKRLRKLGRIGGAKITVARVEDVGKEQMSLMSEVNTNDSLCSLAV